MRQSLDALLSAVYRFYARGVEQDDPRYKDTEEHRRLIQARIQARGKDNPWDILLDRLSERLPGVTIQDGSLHLPTGNWDAGYVGSLWLPQRGPHEKSHQLGFLISFLVPCYVIYSAVGLVPSTTDPPPRSRHIAFTFSPDEEPYVKLLTEEILSVFPGYEPMPPEVGKITVPDVAAGTRLMGKASLYDCLFTDSR